MTCLIWGDSFRGSALPELRLPGLSQLLPPHTPGLAGPHFPRTMDGTLACKALPDVVADTQALCRREHPQPLWGSLGGRGGTGCLSRGCSSVWELGPRLEGLRDTPASSPGLQQPWSAGRSVTPAGALVWKVLAGRPRVGLLQLSSRTPACCLAGARLPRPRRVSAGGIVSEQPWILGAGLGLGRRPRSG